MHQDRIWDDLINWIGVAVLLPILPLVGLGLGKYFYHPTVPAPFVTVFAQSELMLAGIVMVACTNYDAAIAYRRNSSGPFVWLSSVLARFLLWSLVPALVLYIVGKSVVDGDSASLDIQKTMALICVASYVTWSVLCLVVKYVLLNAENKEEVEHVAE